MYTATIVSKNFTEGVMQVLVEFSDGVQTLSKAFNIKSESNLKNEIKNELNRLNELEVFFTALPLGAYTVVDEVTTQATLDKDAWFRDFNRLEQLTKLNTLGALRPNAVAGLDTLRTTVSTDFKNAYIADM